MATLGEQVALVRRSMNATQKQLAAAVQVTPQTISQTERDAAVFPKVLRDIKRVVYSRLIRGAAPADPFDIKDMMRAMDCEPFTALVLVLGFKQAADLCPIPIDLRSTWFTQDELITVLQELGKGNVGFGPTWDAIPYDPHPETEGAAE